MTITWIAALLLCLIAHPAAADAVRSRSPVTDTIDQAQAKMVKIWGAGGYRGMEAYQSGMLVSPDGHILTVWSYVLDTDYITAILGDGRKFQAKLLGADPRLELAVLKIEAEELPHFQLDQAAELNAGTRVLAFSNLFGVATGNEPASVQHGVVSVVTTLKARRGVFETPYNGPVYVLDAATNNPGAAGGALVTRQGRLAGMLGKELRNSLSNTWLNYAVPIGELRESVDQIRTGKFIARENDASEDKPEQPLKLAMLGIVMIPDVLQRTPPYVDQVASGSAAAAGGVKPDDLVLMANDRLIQSCKALRAELEYIDREDGVKLTVLRGPELLEFTLSAR